MEHSVELSREQVIEDPVFTVAIPVRNRWGARLRNCIKSIALQTIQPIEIIVADYGSTREGHKEIMKTIRPFDCSVYYYPTDEIWNLALARNMGIRRSNSSCKYVAVVDADLVLEARVVETLLEGHLSRPKSYISCFIRMLKLELGKPDQPRELQMPEDFSKLRETEFWPSAGWGGLVSAPRSWLFNVRGFDERMKFWGAEDADLWKRAGLAGMDRYRLNDLGREEAEVYHQWHDDCLSRMSRGPEDTIILTEAESNQITWNKAMYLRDHTIMRNNENWGLWKSKKVEEDHFRYG